MKKTLKPALLAALITLVSVANSQTVYNITSSNSISGAKVPTQCTNCVINIAPDAILTINKELYLQNTTFNGGTVLVNKSITFWAPGAFNNVKVEVANNASITSSGALTIKSSQFEFDGNAKATFWAPVTMTSSSMKFFGNSSMEATNTFNIKENSALVAGDGTSGSKAYIHFNGGTLNEYDNSFVSINGANNYYRNWSNYNSISNNQTYKTSFNNINCGTSGKNSCDPANVYGPATLNFAGVASYAMLPVKLSSFSVRASGNQSELSWTTDMEQNSDRFEVERSLDGINWTKIGAVKSNGNATDVNRYAYVDVLKLSGSVSYRLKMVDIDGSFEFSPIKTIKSESAVQMNIFPNPATNYVVISSAKNTGKNVQLINQNGQVIKQVKGNGNVNMSVSEFQSGSYFVRVTDDFGTATSFKLMISK